MGYQPAFNCVHRDNYGRCRIHLVPRWRRWLSPKGREVCIEEERRRVIPQDDDDVPPCPDVRST